MSRHLPLLSACLSVSLLMACQQASVPTNYPGQMAQRYDSVVTVPLQVGDTRNQLVRDLGGTVLSWDDSGCASGVSETCVAVLGMNGRPDTALSGQSAALGRTVYIEPNKDIFSGGGDLTATLSGARSIWAGGDFQAWTGGARSIWAGGSYSLIPQNTQMWSNVKLEQAQALASNLGANITVAVIDTGLDLKHSAFQGSLSDPSTWWDFYSGDATPQDEGTLGVGGYGHGTNVAGIILQVAPKARIMPLRVLGPDGSGDVANVAQAITWAAAKGAKVINLSLGSDQDSKVVQDAIRKVTAQNVLVVASAGNGNAPALTYPAATATSPGAMNLLSVGSVNLQDQKSSFSNYARQLEVMAPGENVYAPAPGELLAAWSGTSMAAPIAAGGLALALGQPLAVPVQDLTRKLMDTSADIYSGGQNQGFKDLLGKGRLDLALFVKATVKAQ